MCNAGCNSQPWGGGKQPQVRFLASEVRNPELRQRRQEWDSMNREFHEPGHTHFAGKEILNVHRRRTAFRHYRHHSSRLGLLRIPSLLAMYG